MNDADLELAELETIGNGIAAARAAGICPHTSVQHLRCTDGCGRQFTSEQDWFDAMDEVIAEWT